MIKKVSVHQLKPGMFIHDMNCGWMEHPFLTGTLKIKNDQEIKKIADNGIHEVYIDTDKGLDVQDAPTESEVKAEIDHELIEIIQKAKPVETASLRDELEKSRRVHSEANKIVHSIMKDIRIGKQIELEQVDPLVAQMTSSIFRNKDALLSLCRIKNKDDYTFLHSVSVGALLISFARALELDRDIIQLLGVGGMLHDVGKMQIANEVLNKPGKFSDDEFQLMKSHVVHSRTILEATPGISQVSIDVAAQHHERFDGSGYPHGLKGEEMSVYGQMASIVDVYDAITSDRCYHKGMAPTEALRKMLEWSKFHFNPKLVHAFIRTIGIYPVGTLVMLESGRVAIVIEQYEKNLALPLVRTVFNAKKNYYIKPEDVYLSKPLGQGGGDKIVSHESPEKWGIDVSKFM
ncbi:MAG: HD-GYP domain-containing protein [Betaproteobacteria bacterium]|nr:HD-GYP domain-containing protein [Betaproteobacteria bacterium]